MWFRKKIIILPAILGCLMGLIFLIVSPASASTFNQNDLMDDVVYNNTSSMTAAQINSFLNTFSGSCISPNSGFYTPDPTGWSASVSTNHGYTFGGNVTAGQAIYDAAQIYDLNPQVILATMQKEQSVVTGGVGCHYSNPSPGDACTYSENGTYGGCVYIAMSYGCPGGCDSTYSSTDGSGFNGIGNAFSLQLIAGTWLLRWAQERSYGILTGYPGYDPGDENIWYGGPMTAGYRQRDASDSSNYWDGTDTLNDGTSVTISNGPTAALYYYTPFISGNMSFDTIFEQWFGTVYGIYTWSVQSQASYTDSSMTTHSDLSLYPGERAYLVVQALNTGDVTWYNSGSNPVRLGTDDPRDGASWFCDPTWLNDVTCNRPAALEQASVAPGQIGTFGFWVTAPSVGGTYNQYYDLVADGLTWMNDPGMYWTFRVSPPTYSWSVQSQSSYTNSSETTSASTLGLLPGQRVYMVVQALNTGNENWSNNGSEPIRLGTDNPHDNTSPFCDPTWLNDVTCNRPTTMQQATVVPGQVGTFGFWITVPFASYGNNNQYFNLVVDGVTWLNDPGMYWTVGVTPPTYSWQLISQQAYTDSTMSTAQNTLSLQPSQRYYLVVTAKNTGNMTWQKGVTNQQVNLGTSRPMDRKSAFCDPTWLNDVTCNRPTTATQTSVAPGQTATFGFWITTPSQTGNYIEYFNLVDEGITWLNDPGMYWTFGVI